MTLSILAACCSRLSRFDCWSSWRLAWAKSACSFSLALRGFGASVPGDLIFWLIGRGCLGE